MKSFFALLAISTIATGTAQSQTPSVTRPTNTTITSRPSVQPPTTPATTSPNRQQELYDQYHSVSKRPSSITPTPPAGQPASRPGSQPTASAPVDGAERPVSLDASRSGVRIGIRGGVTYPAYLEKQLAVDPTAGFVGGFVFQFGRGTLSFQPELNYARYAGRTTIGSGTVVETTINIAQDRFEVPLLLHIASGSVNSTRFFVNVGPYGAYASSASRNGQKVALDGSTGRFSVGAAAGVGAALKAGPGHLTLEVRGLYQLGNTGNGGTINTDSRVINTQATLGYLFPLGGR